MAQRTRTLADRTPPSSRRAREAWRAVRAAYDNEDMRAAIAESTESDEVLFPELAHLRDEDPSDRDLLKLLGAAADLEAYAQRMREGARAALQRRPWISGEEIARIGRYTPAAITKARAARSIRRARVPSEYR